MIALPFLGVILYVLACWLIALIGRSGKFGFWGNFWTSVILTPVIGFVILLAQDLGAKDAVPKDTAKNAGR